MAIELMMNYGGSSSNASFVTKMEESAVQEAASGLESVNKLIRLLSQQQQQTQDQNHRRSSPSSSASADPAPAVDIETDCRTVADAAVSKFRKVISLLGSTRTGHARFRRAPVSAASPSTELIPANLNHHHSHHHHHHHHRSGSEIPHPESNSNDNNKVYYATPIQQIPPSPQDFGLAVVKPGASVDRNGKDSSATTINFSSYSSAANSFVSTLTGETEGKPHQHQHQQPSSSSAFQITNLSHSAGGRPPLSTSSLKRKCSSETLGSGKCLSGGSSGRCHCSKKSRKLRLKRVVRVPAISLKMADIPPDDYSWRKYGQKPIKGSPHPRGYYKCSSVRGCPARKHVERAVDDPSMLVVTYEGDHNHNTLSIAETANLILESS
ncbi:unnamed protein product [Linum trigynum]|uniref:WRKY domain-containing protein n=1 Tax=Linum trigynum TaxID=586398 RepID=A0AAV2DF98_9ROSI